MYGIPCRIYLPRVVPRPGDDVHIFLLKLMLKKCQESARLAATMCCLPLLPLKCPANSRRYLPRSITRRSWFTFNGAMERSHRAGILPGDNVTKALLLRPKLAPYLQDAIATSTLPLTTWVELKGACLNVYSRRPATTAPGESKRRRAKCGKCGKRGHTAGQCRSGN